MSNDPLDFAETATINTLSAEQLDYLSLGLTHMYGAEINRPGQPENLVILGGEGWGFAIAYDQTVKEVWSICKTYDEMEPPYFQGLYGCSCHPYRTYAACQYAHQRKYKIGDRVLDRCTKTPGFIEDCLEPHFYYVNFPNSRHGGSQHAADLIPESSEASDAAFSEGWYAAHEGIVVGDNPYPSNDNDHWHWMTGWAAHRVSSLKG